MEPLDLTSSLPVLEWAERLASAAGAHHEPLPVEWAEARRPRGDHQVVLRSASWRSPGIARLRATHISGLPGLLIVNLGVLPTPSSRIPMVHAEVVVVGGNVRVAILDALVLSSGAWPFAAPPPQAILEALRGRAQPFSTDSIRPDWSAKAISADALWIQPAAGTSMAAIAALADQFLTWVTSLLAAPEGRHLNDPSHGSSERLREIREVFLANEPSRPFLCSTFGSAWGERYMSEFLFPEIEHSPADGAAKSQLNNMGTASPC